MFLMRTMFIPDRTKRKVLTSLIIVAALAGILFFGYRAVRDGSGRSQGNPFEYDIDRYKKSDPGLLGYIETSGIPLELEEIRAIATGFEIGT